MRFPVRVAFLATFAALLVSSPALAQWAENGFNVCTAAFQQTLPLTLSDGAGGALMVWVDVRNGGGSSTNTRDLYGQRLNASGAVVAGWPTNGVSICAASGDQINPAVAADGNGGMFVAWQDQRSGDFNLYLNHILAGGTLAAGWPVDGRLYGSTSGDQQTPCLAPDESGGVFVAWSDSRSGNFDIRALHLDSDGNDLGSLEPTKAGLRAPTPSGNLICGATGDQTAPQAVYGGSNTAIVVWADARGATSDIYGIRVGSNGQPHPSWTADGVLLSDAAAGTDVNPRLVTDDSKGAIVVWAATDQTAIRLQHLTTGGGIAWSASGVVAGFGYAAQGQCIARDGLGGAFVGFSTSNGTGAIAQHISAAGAIASGWPTNGLTFAPVPGTLGYSMIEDASGGVYFAYFADGGIYVQRITGAGTLVSGWPSQGQAIRLGPPGDVLFPTMASDGAGGAIVAWQDKRAGVNQSGRPLDDIYAQRVLPMGLTAIYLGTLNAVADVPADQGGWVALTVTAPTADVTPATPGVTGYNVWRLVSAPQAVALDGARPAQDDALALIVRSHREPVMLSGAQAAASGFPPGSWQSLGFNAATQSASYSLLEPTRNDSMGVGLATETYLVTIHTQSLPQYFVTAPVNGHSADNLPPAIPQSLAGTLVAAGTVDLTWSANSESDLVGYAVYRGIGLGFVPSPANRVGTPTSPAFHDVGYTSGAYYKVAASDRHGNQSGYAVTAPAGATGVDDAVTINYLSPLAPNPFSRDATVTFGLAHAEHVRVTVHDLAGRLVRTLVNGERAAGSQHVRWSGDDDAGRALAPGIYLVRFRVLTGEIVRRVVRVK